MAKEVYIGISNKARRVSDIYIGVNGKARKVVKAYIGVGGKARLFYEFEYPTVTVELYSDYAWTLCEGDNITNVVYAYPEGTYSVTLKVGKTYTLYTAQGTYNTDLQLHSMDGTTEVVSLTSSSGHSIGLFTVTENLSAIEFWDIDGTVTVEVATQGSAKIYDESGYEAYSITDGSNNMGSDYGIVLGVGETYTIKDANLTGYPANTCQLQYASGGENVAVNNGSATFTVTSELQSINFYYI